MVAALKESLTLGGFPKPVGRNRFIAPSASPRGAAHLASPSGAIKRLRPTAFPHRPTCVPAATMRPQSTALVHSRLYFRAPLLRHCGQLAAEFWGASGAGFR